MRTRITGSDPFDYVSGGYSVVYDYGRQPLYNQGPFSMSPTTEYAVIVDDPKWRYQKLPNGSTVVAYKNLTHVKRAVRYCSTMLSYHFPGSPGGTVRDLDSLFYLNDPTKADEDPFARICAQLESFLPESNPYSGHYDRWQKVKPGMETRANLAVFLAELRDVKRMFEILPDRHFHLNDWRQVLKYANSQHLNYNFGWKPFLRDVVNFRNAKESFDRRLVKFLVNRNLLQTKGTKGAPESGSGTTTTNWDSNWKNEFRYDWNVERHSTFQYFYDFPPYSRAELLWRAWADSLGLHLSPRNIWAIVPWSFVVDWFVDVSGFLSQADHPWLQPWITIIQGCSTEAITGSMSWNIVGPSSWGSPRGPVCEAKFRSFKRVVGAPQFQWDAGTLNADKIRLLASLVGSLVL